MQSSWKFFIVIELLLLLWGAYHLLSNVPIFLFFLFALLNIYYVSKKSQRTSFNQFQFFASVIIVILCLLSSPAIWLMLIIAIVFIGSKGIEVSGVNVFSHAPWNKKHMMMVKTTASEPKSGRRFKRKWLGTQRFGDAMYEWNDINIAVVSGDTIIDFGNTLLPKDDNIVIVRKGFGRTRLLVPTGIGIVVEHSTMIGNLSFDGEEYSLTNESIKLYSSDYDNATRRLKVITNSLFGDVEVIRI
ncbi:hypothetical protein CBF34_02885 [Vagococcus penaei]|uniref:Uncharacterized protein n=1 Tax=Vagococcus penaei TaxID=633807 RepID=A0A1Q2D433_9ENTE|nr:cell wall-active antibiotics response protein LiaF [Vagococcus penaei]AQP53065.1 hypothetical protein BW732_01700 [Vagococcus penaei]RSU06071.1 hypothetical protein CBF34_02885 [Vagococcus penaei]